MNEQELSNLLQFASRFSETKEKERQKLPFHLNLIDQLHINENAHSRVLMHLLSYRDEEGKYPILSSLIRYIKDNLCMNEFGRINIKSPIFTQEKARIDLWVRDENYAIIFENKIYNAIDQEEQLSRYIEITKNYHHDENNIFVVYLSQYPKEPEQQSWGKYRDSFKSRYINLCYCNHILNWLKDTVLPSIRYKELYLQTAIIQYIDYLEGLFTLRNIDKPMNMELDKLIEKELTQNKNEKESIKILQERIDSFNAIISQMHHLLNKYRERIFDGWRKETVRIFPDLYPNRVHNEVNNWYITDVTIENVDGKKAIVYLGADPSYLFCGFCFDFDIVESERSLQKEDVPIVNKLKKRLQGPNNKQQLFVSFSENEYDEAYNCFCEIIKEIMS